MPGPPGPPGLDGRDGAPGDPGPPGTTTWAGITDKPSIFPPDAHDHDTAYEAKNANIQTHVGSPHAPANAQANADITKAEIEAKLTGEIASHTHAAGAAGGAKAIYINLLSHFTTLENTTSANATVKIPAATTFGQIAQPLDMTKLGTPASAEFFGVYTNTAASGTNQISLTLGATPRAAGTTVTPIASSVVTLANASTYPQTFRQAVTVSELGSTAQWLQWALNLALSSAGPNMMSLGLILYY